jgi:transposase
MWLVRMLSFCLESLSGACREMTGKARDWGAESRDWHQPSKEVPVARGFVSFDRDQAMLLPHDVREWLPKNHFAWLVLDEVEVSDLAPFYARYRTGAQGRAAYDPKMLVAVLLYAYASCIRSSRDIERKLQEDVAFRVIAANRLVDHATICRFRQRHQEELSKLFEDLVVFAAKEGMARTVTVAVDGTKIEANASDAKTVNDEQLKKLIAKIFEEADRIDAEEDRLYGERRGDELPEDLQDRAERLERLREELGKRPPTTRGKAATINTTDPDSRTMKTPDGYIQGYNAQVAVSDDHFIVAADLTNEASDVNQLEPMVTQAHDNLERAAAEAPANVLADAGYLSPGNAALSAPGEILIAPTAMHRLDEALAKKRAEKKPPRCNLHDLQRRRRIIEAYVAKQITAREAASALNAPINSIYLWAWRLRKFGVLPSVQRYKEERGPSSKEIMLERFRDEGARERYKRRGATVEAVIGQLKEILGLRRFGHRGMQACRSELRVVAAAYNLRRVWHLRQSRAASLVLS